MIATKENAREALRLLTQVIQFEERSTSPEQDKQHNDAVGFVEEFLQSCISKLPSEAAYTRNKSKQRN